MLYCEQGKIKVSKFQAFWDIKPFTMVNVHFCMTDTTIFQSASNYLPKDKM